MTERKVFRSILATLGAITLLIAMGPLAALANTIPPTASDHFYGEADGNMVISATDLNTHRSQILLKPATYDTLQPAAGDQVWNTCDVDGNLVCAAGDLNLLRNYILLKPVTGAPEPWTLENINLPLSGNSTGTWIPFNINLKSDLAPDGAGRAGISVTANIVGGTATGELTGRSCTPVVDCGVGVRDCATVAPASCALAVTVTDWSIAPAGSVGETENGAFGFAIWADTTGTVDLEIRVTAKPGLDIPAVTLTLNVSFGCDPDPTLAGTYDTPGSANVVFVSGSYAYVADAASGLQIIDVSDPESPTFAGTYDTPGSARGVYVSGNYAYVADWNSGLQIIDVSNPVSPTLAGTYDTLGSARRVYVSGNYAYVADWWRGLQIIDVSNPASPTLAGTYDILTPDDAWDVYVSGSYAYVAFAGSGLKIIDVSNPASPTLAGTYDTPYWVVGVYVSGSYAYVAKSNAGLQIIDVSNPASPSLVGTYSTPGEAWDVYVSGSYAYVVDYDSGLHIIDVSNPASPTLAGTYDTPDQAWDVYVSGNYAYEADLVSGLKIIQVCGNNTPPTNNAPIAVAGVVLTLISFDMAPSDPDIPVQALTCSIVSNGCTGGSLNGCVFEWTPAEAEGPQVCVVQTVVNDGVEDGNIVDTTVAVIEVNVAPTNNAPVTVAGDEGTLISFDMAPTDPDIPAQTLTCSIVSNDCIGGSLAGCVFEWTPAEAEGPQVCVVQTVVNDGIIDGNIVSTTVTVNEVNQAPAISNLPVTESGTINLPDSFDVDATDPDIPADALTFSFSANTCLFTPSVDGFTGLVSWTCGASPETCTVDVTVTDDGSPIYSDNETLTIECKADCDDGIDNDSDTFADWPADPGCTDINDTSELGTNECDDGIDNDGDTLVDWPNDIGCSSITDNDERALCEDGIDNDGDTFVDWPDDPECYDSNDQTEREVIWYVDIDAAGAGTGLSWADAFTAPWEAVNASAAGDMIWVAEGAYSSIVMKEGVNIYGGFVGTESVLTDRGAPFLHPTELAGANNNVIGASNARLDGFVVKSGFTYGGNVGDCWWMGINYCQGGGMLNIDVTNLIVDNCIFSGNAAIYGGGGMFNGNVVNLQVLNTIFENNYALEEIFYDCCCDEWGDFYPCPYGEPIGGGMRNENSIVDIVNCIFKGNDALWDGGAIYNDLSSILSLTNTTFSTNNAGYDGGAIYNVVSSTTDITNCILWGDMASVSPEIYNAASTVTVTYSNIEGGYAGAGNIDTDPLFLNSPDFWDATTTVGTSTTIKVQDASLYSVDDIIEYANDGVPRIVTSASGSTVTFTPSTFPFGSTMIGKIVSNWGPGAADVIEDFHLQLGSPCIDTADPASTITNDLDGNPRPAGLGYDMGAYEYQ